MPPEVGVEVSKRGDRTPSPGKVGEVEVRRAYGVRAEIEGARSERAIWEVPLHGLPAGEERHLRLVESEEEGGPQGKQDSREISGGLSDEGVVAHYWQTGRSV